MSRRLHSHSKWLVSILFMLAMILSCLSLTACGGAPSSGSAVPNAEQTSTTGVEQVFTREELAAFDGLEDRNAYIAVDGVVYDVTAVFQWGSKLHAGKFQAGKDYSEEIKKAPHGVDKLLEAVRIGTLVD